MDLTDITTSLPYTADEYTPEMENKLREMAKILQQQEKENK